MLKFQLDRELPPGLYGDDEDVIIVEETPRPQGDEDRLWLEEGPSLRDIEAMEWYIKGQFPQGWHITTDGEIRGRSNAQIP